MSYQRSKNLSEKEKKLQSLRMQLYGQEPEAKVSLPQKHTEKQTISFNTPATHRSTTITDNNYLRRDLLKSLLLATLALAIQITLYLSLQRGLLRF